jgi:hypothetical protein
MRSNGKSLSRLNSQSLRAFKTNGFFNGTSSSGQNTTGRFFLEKRENGHYFNWDRLNHKLLFLDGPETLAKQSGLLEFKQDKPILIFDEIHKF